MNAKTLSNSNHELPLDFENMEIEAKFVVSDLKAFEKLKSLQGQRLEDYFVYFRYEAIFLDRYYDTNELDIFKKDGALRARRRFRDTVGDVPRDARFQGKDATSKIDAVFFRHETRGKRSRDPDNWEEFLRNQLDPSTQDKAVEFIREFAEIENKPIQPVLEIRNVRYRLMLSKNFKLLYEISLDQLQSIGLVGKQLSQYQYECEIESISDRTKENVCELIRLSNQVGQMFGLIPSPDSKYRRGIQAVVDENI